MESGQPTDIGKMRWRVALSRLDNIPVGTYNTEETFAPVVEVYAEIKPVSLQTFIGSQEIDNAEVTHRIIFRWQPFLDVTLFNFIHRDILVPDGTVRRETYQIRRAEEFQGRHRFIIADCWLRRAG